VDINFEYVRSFEVIEDVCTSYGSGGAFDFRTKARKKLDERIVKTRQEVKDKLLKLKELQTKADTGSLKADFSNINKSAVEMALPIAKTNAIKDACDHIGKLFGRDLNRKDSIEFTPKYMDIDIDSKLLEKGRAV
jgi:hypothetical protein